jgi:hypothetical protein
MADNIKIVGNVNNTQRISRFKSTDTNLLSINDSPQTFGYNGDFIEFFVYDDNNNLLSVDYNYTNFKLPFDQPLQPNTTLPTIQIDPFQDIQNVGYNNGSFKTQYSFFKRKFSSSNIDLFISEISEDRTEIRVNSINLSSSELVAEAQKIIDELTISQYQKYYIANFNIDIQQTIINVAIDNTTNIPSVLFKLYEPLEIGIFEKDTLWVTEEITEPYVFNINLDLSIIPAPLPKLRGPNFDIDLDIKQNINTEYQNYSSLVSSLTGSSYYKVLNFMNDNSYDLNIDYTSFENFIHFSSAKKRLEIFYNKAKQIEDYNSNINILVSSTSLLKNTETASIKLKIDNIVKHFDGFESYLYHESSSYAWPKLGSNKPYTLLSTGSLIFKTWYTSYTSSAAYYDDENLDHLYNAIPEYIKNDPINYQPYYNFIDMIGHYFDNIWIYITSINELYNADNNLEKGVSKDIVYDALKSLGVKLYNSKGNDQFDDYIGGLNSGSVLFADDFSVTSSYLNNISKKDQLAETYKRIYHNLILLNKNKGTSTGLQNLITTFGVTSSIFTPKELGGSTRTGGLKGYDNDKITIQNNTVTGSVLSPFISVQQPFTGSDDFTSTDLHFIDLSFSPQTALDLRVSSSIAISRPTFSLDDYIGDPRLMESSSYDALDIQKQEYFINSGSITNRLDYKGFFELVKYFDNSLFKMLKDFVPARANALTGVTIKSPVLERNKIKVYQPKATEEIVHDAEYAAPVISEDRDYHYDKIVGNKSQFYTGEFNGSYTNINDVFENSNPNPYLIPTQSIDINKFNHSEFNITLNNVSSSRNSVGRSKLENIFNSSLQIVGSYSSSAELQDSQLNLLGHKSSRYDGVKLSSKTYNTYSTSSLVYNGDISYGKTAVIDHNTRKIGLFTQITENIFLPSTKKNNVALRYLVDENGGLTELNRKNKHWHELQNTFKSGDDLTVTLFNNQKTSDQKSTDGSKFIFNSGYTYVPMLYFSGSESTVYFEYAGENVGKIFQAKNFINISPGPTGYIYGGAGGSNGYPLSPSGSDTTKKVIYNIFDIIESNDSNVFTAGDTGTTLYPTFTVPAAGSYTFSNEFDIYIDLKSSLQSVSFKYEVIKGSLVDGHPTGTILGSTGIKTLSSAYSAHLFNRGSNYINNDGFQIDSYELINIDDIYEPLTVFDGYSNKIVTLTWADSKPSPYALNGDDGNTYYLALVEWSFNAGGGYIQQNQKLILSRGYNGAILSDDYILEERYQTEFFSNQTGTLSFNLTTGGDNLSTNDKIYFKLTKESSTTANYTASFSTAGKLRNNLVTNTFGDFVFALGSTTNHLISCSIASNNDGNFNAIVLNTSLTTLENYQFIAEQGVGDNKILYNSYGSVNEIFTPSVGDVVVMYWEGQNVELTIKSLDYFNSKRSIVFTTNLPSSLKTKLNDSSSTLKGGVDVFLLLKKKPDETNVLLKFNKKAGNTSLGFIIPNNLHPDVLANIDTITKEVKQKLIDLETTNIGSSV